MSDPLRPFRAGLIFAAAISFCTPLWAQPACLPSGVIDGVWVEGARRNDELEYRRAEIRRGASPLKVKLGRPLCPGDQIFTGDQTYVQFKLGREGRAHFRTVLAYPNSHYLVEEDSFVPRLGRYFLQLRGYFTSILAGFDALLAARGTELELQVDPGGARIAVLQGAVDVESRQLSVGALEQATLDKSSQQPVRPSPLSEDEVRELLARPDQFILTPPYPPPRVLSDNPSPQDRKRIFDDNRLRAVWGREAEAWQSLGALYLDWNLGVRALEAGDEALLLDPSTYDNSPIFQTQLAEAYRLSGRFESADRPVRRALDISPDSAPAHNASANLALSRAELAFEDSQSILARSLLRRAQESYATAARGIGLFRSESRAVPVVGLGEVQLQLGQIAFVEEDFPEAADRFEEARRHFLEAATIDPDYLYARIGVFRADQGLARIARFRGDFANALDRYAVVRTELQLSVLQFPESDELHFSLGELLEEVSRPEPPGWPADSRARAGALQGYRRAIEIRPDNPRPYYRLAVLLQDSDPLQAWELFQVYWLLELPSRRLGQQFRDVENRLFAPAFPRRRARFRVGFQSEAVFLNHDLNRPFQSFAGTRTIFDAPINISPPFFPPPRTETTTETIENLRQTGWLEWQLARISFQMFERLSIHGMLGAGRLRSDFDNFMGQTLVQENESPPRNLPLSSISMGGEGQYGLAYGAAIETTALEGPASALVLEGNWKRLEADEDVFFSNGVEIARTRIDQFDVDARLEWRRDRFHPFAGARFSWQEIAYDGSFQRIAIVTGPDPIDSMSEVRRERLSFRTQPQGFPISGLLGFHYEFSPRFRLSVDGSVGDRGGHFRVWLQQVF